MIKILTSICFFLITLTIYSQIKPLSIKTYNKDKRNFTPISLNYSGEISGYYKWAGNKLIYKNKKNQKYVIFKTNHKDLNRKIIKNFGVFGNVMITNRIDNKILVKPINEINVSHNPILENLLIEKLTEKSIKFSMNYNDGYGSLLSNEITINK